MKNKGKILVGCGGSSSLAIASIALAANHSNMVVVDINQLKETPKFTLEPFKLEAPHIFEMQDYNCIEEKRGNKPFYYKKPKKKRRTK